MEEQVVVVRGSREDRKQRAAPIEEGNKAVSYLSDKGDREVSLVKHIGSGKAYAMKVLRKRRVLQFGQLRCTMDEKRILQLMVDKPFIAKLQWAFQDSERLYLVLELLVGNRPFEPNGSTETILFPEDKVVNTVAQDLLRGLLKKSPTQRYSENSIRCHAYFSRVRWVECVFHLKPKPALLILLKVSQKRYTPPWIPNIDKSNVSVLDTRNFQLDDEEPDPEPDLGFPPESSTASQGRDVFRGFSFDQADSARSTGTSGSTSPVLPACTRETQFHREDAVVSLAAPRLFTTRNSLERRRGSAQETAKEGMPGPNGKENHLGGAILDGVLGRMVEPEKNVVSYDVLEDEQVERILRKRKRAGVSADVADLPVKRTKFEHV
ncbi:hypothetical protein BT69DRAFT_1316613 [Atractiella rhizophila]|nr:hypothetical protein BT69DRAFT_1316613 [Atractiella rhizophila]